MEILALPRHRLFAVGLFMLSVVLTWAMLRARVMDVPNRRSSHDRPVPKSGGVAIVLTFAVGYAVVVAISDDARIATRPMIAFGGAGLAIAAVSLLDDLRRMRFWLKLAAQLLAAAVLLGFDVVVRTLSLPFIGAVDLGVWAYPVTALWLVGLTNIFNFMDGLDGLAGGTGAIVAAFFGLIAFLEGSHFAYILSYILLAACLGFTVFNFPRALIFMGDVGSQFLGFTFAALAVLAAEFDASHTSFLVLPLLFFHFIFDTVFTFCRRLFAGEDVTRAHRSHLYQLANRLGYSHVAVSLLHYALTVVQGLAALWLVRLDAADRPWVFLPFLVFEGVYAGVVMRGAARHNLLRA